MARWIDCWDSQKKTEWWHCIKDNDYNIDILKAKRRYEIKKGAKNFRTCFINPNDYVEELYAVFIKAYKEYPKMYRPSVTQAQVRIACKSWSKERVIGSFDLHERLQGFALLIDNGNYVGFSMLRVNPLCQKQGINFAIVNFICEWFMQNTKIIYIDDGERNIRHITAFQDFLIKYFGFRRAYCRLNIIYNPLVKMVVFSAYPFKKLFAKLAVKNSMLYNFYCLLNQEEIRRSFCD